jgi:phosphoserine phosphatase
MTSSVSLKPICVDLDGTLVKNDVTMMVLRRYVKDNFLHVFKVFYWFLHGRAYLKHKLAKNVNLDVSSLNYNQKFLNFIIDERKKGRRIFLATACNQNYAHEVADFLNIFDGVFASNEHINLRAGAKAMALTAIFGKNGFIYAGNSKDDLEVWDKSAECILVAPQKTALKKMQGKKYVLFE